MYSCATWPKDGAVVYVTRLIDGFDVSSYKSQKRNDSNYTNIHPCHIALQLPSVTELILTTVKNDSKINIYTK